MEISSQIDNHFTDAPSFKLHMLLNSFFPRYAAEFTSLQNKGGV